MTSRDLLAPRLAGRLILIVGASGAGKDSLIGAARHALGSDPGFDFPRRVITRQAGAGGEDFQSVTVEEFERRRRLGQFAFHWRSHGLNYGVPATATALIGAGRRVVVNVSRTMIDVARVRYPGTHVIHIVANPSVVAQRLRDRGREAPADIAVRLERAGEVAVRGPNVTIIDNSGRLDRAAALFIDALQRD